jgi:hypothetical protein
MMGGLSACQYDASPEVPNESRWNLVLLPSVGIMVEYGMDWGLIPINKEFLSGVHPTSYPTDTLVPFLRDKHKVDHSPPSSVQVKNYWRSTSSYPYIIVRCLIKQRDSFTFTKSCRLLIFIQYDSYFSWSSNRNLFSLIKKGHCTKSKIRGRPIWHITLT